MIAQFMIFQLYHGAKVACIINCMRYLMLYYKTGFVLDNLALLQANVSVMSSLKVG